MYQTGGRGSTIVQLWSGQRGGGAVRLAQNTGDGTGAGRDSSDSTGSCRDGGINGNVVDRAQGAKGARGRLRRSLGASSAVDR